MVVTVMTMMVIIIIIIITIIMKGLKEYLEAIPGNHSIDPLQKTAVLGTSHIIRKVLQSETGSLSGGDRRWFKGSTGGKWPVARDS
jgi:hypothetical protein